MIENMKGVIKTTVKSSLPQTDNHESKKWIRKMEELGNMVDTSVIDMNDERTLHIMSK